jgi:hypothetical protein
VSVLAVAAFIGFLAEGVAVLMISGLLRSAHRREREWEKMNATFIKSLNTTTDNLEWATAELKRRAA